MSETTGKVDFIYAGKTYQTWYKVVGDLTSGVRPLLVLHGGPGLSHHYVLPFKQLYAQFNIPCVFYDQLGIGESTHVKDAQKEFWTPDLWMDELDNLLEHLGIAKRFDVAGHSWGAMLAAHYASHRHPPGLGRLVLASGAPSMALWIESVRSLLAEFPQEMKDIVEKHESAGTTSDEEYQTAMKSFYAKHVCRLSAWPEELNQSFASLEADPTVYSTTLGPSEFTIVGTFKNWSCLDKIHTIQNPTLLTNGRYDEAQDVCQFPFFSRIPKARWVTFAESSHMAYFEERERYFNIVGKFLTEAE